MGTVLDAIPVMRGIAHAIAVSHAITVEVVLTPFHLGTLLCIRTAISTVALALRQCDIRRHCHRCREQQGR
jgi:cbb3-type cytochrome oxidase cytochrome c subunit